MPDEIKKSILRTLAYADVFDYPLTKEEIWQYLISENKISKKTLFQTLYSHLTGGNTITAGDRFFYFKKRMELIDKRLEREKESEKKLKLTRKIISKLSIVPTIQLIGISGALAMNNSDSDDDIDLFVITKKNKLWITRFLLLLFLQLMGYRRKRNDKNVADKICLNMLMDESSLCLPKEKQNLYTAHEILQMKPVFERNNSYRRFMKENGWIEKFLPNAAEHGTKLNKTRNYTESLFSVVLCMVLLCSAIEAFLKAIQIRYLRQHQTTETVTDNLLAFHPIDYKNKVLKHYNDALKKYEI